MGNLCCSALNPGASDPPPAHCVPQPGAKVPAPAPAPARKAQPGSGPEAKVAQNAAPNTARPKTESLAEKLKREGQEKAAAAPAAGVLAGVVGGATDFSAGNQAALSGSTEEAAAAKEREETGAAEAAKAKQTEEKAAAAARVAAEAEAARLAEAEAAARLAEEKRLAAEAAEKQRRAEAEAEKAAQDRPAAAAPAAAAEATVVASTGAKEKAEAADGFPEASVSVENVHLNVVGECASRSGACGVCTSYEIVHLMQSCGALARSAHTDSTLSPSLPCRVASKTSRYRTSLQQAAAKAPERMPIAAAGAVGGARRRAGEGSLEEKRGKAEARPRPCSALLPFR